MSVVESRINRKKGAEPSSNRQQEQGRRSAFGGKGNTPYFGKNGHRNDECIKSREPAKLGGRGGGKEKGLTGTWPRPWARGGREIPSLGQVLWIEKGTGRTQAGPLLHASVGFPGRGPDTFRRGKGVKGVRTHSGT